MNKCIVLAALTVLLPTAARPYIATKDATGFSVRCSEHSTDTAPDAPTESKTESEADNEQNCLTRETPSTKRAADKQGDKHTQHQCAHSRPAPEDRDEPLQKMEQSAHNTDRKTQANENGQRRGQGPGQCESTGSSEPAKRLIGRRRDTITGAGALDRPQQRRAAL